MTRRTTRCLLAGAGVALAALAAASPRAGWAQVADSAPAKDTAEVKDTAQAEPQVTATTSVPRYLADHARALRLTPKQVDRVREVAGRLDSANAPLRAQWQQITGARTMRAIPPAERRQLAPQLQPVMRQIRANNETALDSVDAILTPAQQQHLQSVLQEYRRRMQMRARRAPPVRP